jgi:N,N'-diacetyllegionaminate synthase
VEKIQYCAELGSGHQGSLYKAQKLIDAAAEAGASAVKVQLFRADSLDARPAVQQKLKFYELPLEWLPALEATAHMHGLAFGVTPFAVDLVEPLRGFIDFVKIAAYDLPFTDLLEACGQLDVPVVLSTAMATRAEILSACHTLSAVRSLILLHGTAVYPAQIADARLARLHTLAAVQAAGYCQRYGLSDHTLGITCALLAVASGATWIEKHMGLYADNPDAVVAVTPTVFAAMVSECEMVRELFAAAPEGPLPVELPLYTTARRSNAKRRRA